jgi:hypothetical protein
LSTEALTIINQPVGVTDLAKGGFGTNSKLFKLQPATIQLVQKMSRAEGAIPGKFRIKETGQHFDEMQLVLLFEPIERRSYFEGDDFAPENQLCFSLDNIAPHAKARIPQAMACAACAKASWERYRQTGNKADIPKCKNYYHNMVIDRQTQLPYYLDVKSTSIKPYIKGMQQVARTMALIEASEGRKPNIFDVSFKIYPVSEGKGTYYTIGFKDFAPVKSEDRDKFGGIFVDFFNSRNRVPDAELAAKVEAEAAQESLEGDLVAGAPIEGEYVGENDEIPI